MFKHPFRSGPRAGAKRPGLHHQHLALLSFIEIDIANACLIHTREIAENMAAAGWSVDVFLPLPLQKQKWRGVTMRWVRLWGFDRLRSWFFFVESACRILAVHLRDPFDLIYVREMERNPFSLLLARLLRRPLFVEVNGWLLDDLQLIGMRQSRLRATQKHQQKLFRLASGIVVSTPGNAQRILTFYSISSSKLHIQELGANTNHFKKIPKASARSKIGLPQNNELIIFAGSFNPHHDLITLIKGFEKLAARSPSVILALVGEGAQAAAIKQWVAQSRLGDRVMIPGARPYEEMPLWFSAADIAVLPLTCKKIRQQNGCLALKLWEYMAAGLPVVATDFNDTPTAKLLKQIVVKVSPEEPDEMFLGLSHLLANPAARVRLGEAGRRYVSKQRSWEKAASETMEFIFSK